MTRYFLPGCHNRASYPHAMERLESYLLERGHVDRVAGCCRPGRPAHEPIPPGSDVVCLCNTCHAVAAEGMGCRSVEDAFALIADDPAFPYPDYRGERIAVQDCWRARGNRRLHDAVRRLLANMNMEPVELPDARDASVFCGISTLEELPADIRALAPGKFADPGDGLFTRHEPAEMRRLMRDRAARIPTPRVVTYCFSCDQGLTLGGADSASLLNLLFDPGWQTS